MENKFLSTMELDYGYKDKREIPSVLLSQAFPSTVLSVERKSSIAQMCIFENSKILEAFL